MRALVLLVAVALAGCAAPPVDDLALARDLVAEATVRYTDAFDEARVREALASMGRDLSPIGARQYGSVGPEPPALEVLVADDGSWTLGALFVERGWRGEAAEVEADGAALRARHAPEFGALVDLFGGASGYTPDGPVRWRFVVVE